MLIRTVLGDISPSSLGVTLAHDHLYALPPEDVSDPDLRMDSEEAATQELEAFKRASGGAVVEMTTVDYGRDGAVLERISRASGVHVVAATGFNKGVFADHLTANRSIEDIAAWMTREVNIGLEPFSAQQPHAEHAPQVRAGLIKASSGLRDANENELKVFAAAVQAHRRTGAPISTHTEKGTWALEQTRFFVDGAVNLERVLIGHLDLKPELNYLLEVAETGVRMGFDQFGKSKYLSDRSRVDLIVKLCEAGHAKQLLLGGDMARKSYFKSYGGSPGLTHIPTTVRAMLEDSLPLETVNDLLIHNAARLFAFTPVTETGSP